MESEKLRKKWSKAITEVDDRFLQLVDALYDSYSKSKDDFFDALPSEIKELLLESREDIKNGDFYTHENIMSEFKEKYNISK